MSLHNIIQDLFHEIIDICRLLLQLLSLLLFLKDRWVRRRFIEIWYLISIWSVLLWDTCDFITPPIKILLISNVYMCALWPA